MGNLIYILLAIAECGVWYSFAGLCYQQLWRNKEDFWTWEAMTR